MTEAYKVPAEEIKLRTLNIQREMQERDIDGIFIIQRVDLFYFSGTSQNGYLFIPSDGDPLLMVKRYMPRARLESSIRDVVEIGSIKEVPGLISDRYGSLPSKMGLELDVIPVREYLFYRELFPDLSLVDASPLILGLRAVKSPWEIRQMENTAEMTRKTFEYMTGAIRPGLTEMEFAGMFETFARRLGHGGKLRVRDYQSEGYPWHVLSGRSGGMVGLLDSPASGEGSSAAFPCGAGGKLLEADEPIMIDLGSVLNGYHMDETRMFAIRSMPRRALDASRAVIKIYDEVMEMARPGVTVDDLFQRADRVARSLGYEEVFLGPPGYKVTFIGHAIGLELIEPPVIARGRKDILKPGMTFALEPKMAFDNEFAAGVESVFTVTETGSRLISRVPTEIFICGG